MLPTSFLPKPEVPLHKLFNFFIDSNSEFDNVKGTFPEAKCIFPPLSFGFQLSRDPLTLNTYLEHYVIYCKASVIC